MKTSKYCIFSFQVNIKSKYFNTISLNIPKLGGDLYELLS